MHVAIVCPDMGSASSVASVALRGAQEIARRARVTLISNTFPSDVGSVGIHRVRMPNLSFLRRFRHVPDEVAFARSARNVLLRLTDVDVLLCHGHAVAELAGRPYREHSGVPFALIGHGEITDCPPGTFDSRLTAFYRWVTPRAYRSADLTIALSNRYAELARQSGAREVVVIPNGFDDAEIGGSPPFQPRADGEPLRLLYVGRLSVEKGVQVLTEASEHLDVSHTIDIVGSGPLESDLRKRTASHIRLLGPRPRKDLGAIYSNHDVVCVPSLAEISSLVIVEAFAVGVPVIATDVGGNPDLVQDGFNGILVPPNSSLALSQAIRKLAQDESLRLRLASRTRASVIPRLGWRFIGDQMSEVLFGLSAKSAGMGV
jgi:glycosyltransferase involved in cell wall biosynthesis